MFETETGNSYERGTTPRFYGKYAGVVLNNEPPDDDTPHRGQILVEVQGIMEEDEEGEGPRALQVTAKPCLPPGFFFVPAQGDHVWVEFVAGDINEPLWSGVWYPSEGTPRNDEEEDPTEWQRVIRTPAGHVLQLDDTEEGESIVLRHKTETRIQVDPNGAVKIELKDGPVVEIKEDDTISVTAGTITLTGDVTIEGNLVVKEDTTSEGVLTVGTGPTTTIDGNEISGG